MIDFISLFSFSKKIPAQKSGTRGASGKGGIQFWSAPRLSKGFLAGYGDSMRQKNYNMNDTLHLSDLLTSILFCAYNSKEYKTH
jgi:hypothetical protein